MIPFRFCWHDYEIISSINYRDEFHSEMRTQVVKRCKKCDKIKKKTY